MRPTLEFNYPGMSVPQTSRLRAVSHHLLSAALAVALLVTCSGVGPASAQNKNARPYDPQLFRLAEILGAVHYLRELCDAEEGQQWRGQMKGLLDAEGATAVRRARLTRSFNNGYRSYSRTYVNCTPSAKSAISKFLTQGVEISETLIKAKP